MIPDALGYTDHSIAHTKLVAERAADILNSFGYGQNVIECTSTGMTALLAISSNNETGSLQLAQIRLEGTCFYEPEDHFYSIANRFLHKS